MPVVDDSAAVDDDGAARRGPRRGRAGATRTAPWRRAGPRRRGPSTARRRRPGRARRTARRARARRARWSRAPISWTRCWLPSERSSSSSSTRSARPSSLEPAARPPGRRRPCDQPAQLAEEAELLADLHRRVQAALLGQVAEAAASRRGSIGSAVEAHRAGVEGGEPEDGPHRRRLAGAVGPEEPGDRARLRRRTSSRRGRCTGPYVRTSPSTSNTRGPTVRAAAPAPVTVAWPCEDAPHDVARLLDRRRRPARADPAGRHRARTSSSGCWRCCAEGAERGCDLVVFPELALTTFFPRWFVDDIAEFDHFYETSMPGAGDAAAVRRGAAARRRLLPRLRRADRARRRRRRRTAATPRSSSSATARSSPATARCTSPATRSTSRTARSSTPSATTSSPAPEGFGVWRAFGGLVGMMICNDRRWPESYRVMGLQGVELILCGYNTPIHYAPDPSQDIAAGLPQRARDAVGRLPERHVGGRRRQGRRRGGRRLAGPEHDRRPVGPDRRPGADRPATSWSSPAATSTGAPATQGTLFDFDRYRRPEVYTRITGPARRRSRLHVTAVRSWTS